MHIISNIMAFVVMVLLFFNEYEIIQANHYEFKRYLYYLKEHKRYYLFLYFLLFVFVINIPVLFITLSFFVILFLVNKKRLKWTNRFKRTVVINLLILFICFISGYIRYIYPFSFFYLFFLHLISLFLEKIFFIKHLKSARRNIKDKVVIGITGSGGKTSIKNMIYDILINEFNVSKTPKSYNNKVGIVKGINDEVKKYDDYFVCEYGVDRVGAMDILTKVLKPNIAVISYIGNQHLLTFKSKENIFKEKIKLIEATGVDGCGIINNDDECLRNYNYRNKRIIRYGINHKSDVMGKNIVSNISYSEFDLYIKDKFITRVHTKLLGMHSIENILAVIGVLLALNIEIEYIVKYIDTLSPVEHRLEYKIIEGIEVIDDSFNSNEKGFKNAIELLLTSSKYKIVITPGIIEQGANNRLLNTEIAKYLLKCDFVCLVSENGENIAREFKNNHFDNYKQFDTFYNAFNFAKAIDKEKIILIENDLPDIYLK